MSQIPDSSPVQPAPHQFGSNKTDIGGPSEPIGSGSASTNKISKSIMTDRDLDISSAPLTEKSITKHSNSEEPTNTVTTAAEKAAALWKKNKETYDIANKEKPALPSPPPRQGKVTQTQTPFPETITKKTTSERTDLTNTTSSKSSRFKLPNLEKAWKTMISNLKAKVQIFLKNKKMKGSHAEFEKMKQENMDLFKIELETKAAISHRKEGLEARKEMLTAALEIGTKISQITGETSKGSDAEKLLTKIKEYASPSQNSNYQSARVKRNTEIGKPKFELEFVPPGGKYITGEAALEAFIEGVNQEIKQIDQDLNCLPSQYDNNENSKSQPITLSSSFHDDNGFRAEMEDAHFNTEVNNGKGHLSGVFDGHGGDAVSKRASELFPDKFQNSLRKNKGDVGMAFKSTFKEIQKEIIKEGIGKIKATIQGAAVEKCQGCTAVVSYIDKTTGLIYTGVLGDAEAAIYRKDASGKIKAIPLTRIIDWTDPEEFDRAQKNYESNPGPWGADSPKKWEENDLGPKNRHPKNGPDSSRALGDTPCDALSQEPLITVRPFLPGDKVALSCDGIGNYLSLAKRAELAGNYSGEILAKQFCRVAKANMNERNSDNMTVIIIEAQAKPKAK